MRERTKVLLGYDEEKLKTMGGYATAKEINQQPWVWRELFEIIQNQKDDIVDFLDPILNKEEIKVILTGAGTSAFVGESSVGYLRRKLGINVCTVDSTDIVASPDNYLFKNQPTLLISHARSGDSPESLAAINLAEKIIDDVHFINITCNKNGKMAINTGGNRRVMNIFMPEESNDEGFAMTSSFTCMLLTDLMLPHIKNIEKEEDLFNKLADEAQRIIKEDFKGIIEISKYDYDRLIYLGSGNLKGCAKEAALKSLELSHGIVNTASNTPLGFRHGPKSAINDKTLLGFFVSNNEYTQRYDCDMIDEIINEPGGRKLWAVLPNDIKMAGLDYRFSLKDNFSDIDEAYLTPLYIIYTQMLGFYKSLNLGIMPDNPNPEGRVSRVVREFKLYEYNNK